MHTHRPCITGDGRHGQALQRGLSQQGRIRQRGMVSAAAAAAGGPFPPPTFSCSAVILGWRKPGPLMPSGFRTVFVRVRVT